MQFLRGLILLSVAGIYLCCVFWANESIADVLSNNITQNDTAHPPFVIVDTNQNKRNPAKSSKLNHCIFDKRTHLVWEVKSKEKGLQYAKQSYSWYEPDMNTNGGFSGYRNSGKCDSPLCDTKAYIVEINRRALCGYTNWRLPTREELRTLVDYKTPYPGPSINEKFFPNTQSQFYWSATPNANDPQTAWGIGFSFGYDYAYFKSDYGYIRLVSGPN